MKIIRFELKLLVLSIISITFLLSCENDTTDIGGNLIPDKSSGNTAYVDLVAYNVSNNDTIRADYATLANGLIGVYEDNTFGKSKASFSTQLRLSFDEIKGTIQEVDSVVLSIYPPSYDSSKSKTEQITDPSTGNIKSITQYPLYSYSYLGNGDVNMDIEVNRINTFLESSESKFYSDKSVDVGDLLGTATISNYLTSVSIKNSDGTVVLAATTPGYRIKLEPAYFQQNFFNKKGSVELSDNSQFIQYFKGIKISPTGDISKFMLNFPKSTMTVIAYYKYKNNASDAEYTSTSYAFTMNSIYNSSVGEYNFYGRNTANNQFKQQTQNPDKVSGESELYLQGMGGPSINLKLDEAQLTAIKDSVQNKRWAIIGAKLNFYLTEDAASKPRYIYGYNLTENKFISDLTSYSGLAGYYFNPVYDFTNNPGYYTLNVTQHIKDIVEKNKTNGDILVGLGNFLINSSGAYIGYYRNTRAYEPFRLIFYGNKAAGDKKLRLEIVYTKN